MRAFLQLANDTKLSRALENVAECLVLAPRYDQDRCLSDCMCVDEIEMDGLYPFHGYSRVI